MVLRSRSLLFVLCFGSLALGLASGASAAEPPPYPAPNPGANALPINLPAALRLANARAIDVAVASQRIEAAAAQFDRAKVLWLPTIYLGGDYFRQDGQLQDDPGLVFGQSKSSLMAGAGPVAVFALTDAIFEPLAARQVVQARQAALQAASNDTFVAVADAYFNVQQARGELAGAEDAQRRAAEVAKLAESLKEDLIAPVEAVRARTELSHRKQAVTSARERWERASAELVRIVRLESSAIVNPVEPPHLEVSLVAPGDSLDELIAQALSQRPELAAQQALVQATLRRLKEEKLRPLLPSVLLRGAGTNPSGILSSGVFGGGQDSRLGDFSMRNTMDVEILWQLQNLGFGNKALVKERRADKELAVLEQFRIQDRIAAEVASAFAQVQSAANRIADAEVELKDALDSAKQNFEGMTQTRRVGNVNLPLIRPQEALAAVQALAFAYQDYYGAVADYNRGQFRLYRALGCPAQQIIDQESACPIQK